MLNKKMLLSLLVIGVVSVSAGAGTWAYFSDTETSTDNTFTAGTLDLELDGADGITGFGITDVAPGDSGEATSIVVSNAGSIDGDLTVSISDVDDEENGEENDAEAEDDDTSSNDGYAANDGSAIGDLSYEITLTVSDGTTTYVGNLNTLTNLVDMDFGSIGADKTITVSYAVDTDADNQIQGDSVSFDIDFSLDQPEVVV